MRQQQLKYGKPDIGLLLVRNMDRRHEDTRDTTRGVGTALVYIPASYTFAVEKEGRKPRNIRCFIKLLLTHTKRKHGGIKQNVKNITGNSPLPLTTTWHNVLKLHWWRYETGWASKIKLKHRHTTVVTWSGTNYLVPTVKQKMAVWLQTNPVRCVGLYSEAMASYTLAFVLFLFKSYMRKPFIVMQV